jgi:hypothetical protein
MENNILLEKVAKLPDNLKSEVLDFIDFLLTKKVGNNGVINKPVFGSGKGMFEMSPDFDEPLEDFKEYM